MPRRALVTACAHDFEHWLIRVSLTTARGSRRQHCMHTRCLATDSIIKHDANTADLSKLRSCAACAIDRTEFGEACTTCALMWANRCRAATGSTGAQDLLRAGGVGPRPGCVHGQLSGFGGNHRRPGRASTDSAGRPGARRTRPVRRALPIPRVAGSQTHRHGPAMHPLPLTCLPGPKRKGQPMASRSTRRSAT